MKTRLLKMVKLTCVLSSLWLLGCSQHLDKIGIGVLMPMTGENATFGVPIRNGIEFAIRAADTNRYEFYFADSGNDVQRSISAVRDLIFNKHVSFIIGDFSSTTTLAIEPIARKAGVFLLSPGAQTPKLTNISPLFARNYPTTVEESIVSARLSRILNPNGSMAVLSANDEYGLALANQFCVTLEHVGVKVSYRDTFGNNQKDFRPLLSKLENSGAKLLYLAGNPNAMGVFMKQYGEGRFRIKIISNIAFLEKACLGMAGVAADGVYVLSTFYDPNSGRYQSVKDFVETYRREVGSIPTIAEAVGYDAVRILLYGIEKSGGGDPCEVAAIIRNLRKYEGAVGELNFKDGDVSYPIIVKQIKSGRPEDVSIMF